MTPAQTPVTGDLLYTEVEEHLRASVRALLGKHADPAAVLARTESAEHTDRELWAALATDVGCAGLAVPESLGGAGASWREAAVVAEELGRAVAPVPFLGSSVLATALLLELAAESDPAAALLEQLARGEVVAALAIPVGTAPRGARAPEVTVHQGTLSGTVGQVADAGIADVLLVPAGDALHAVRAGDPGVTVRPLVSLDMTRPLAEITLDAVPVTALRGGASVGAALTRALEIGAAVLASEQLGVAERCLTLTVSYAGQRHQFGRPIGSFQAVKHRLADVWIAVSQARAVARYAATCAATGAEDLAVAAALAQAHCSTVVQLAAEECLQLHGGIGFTWEHPAHLYLKRAKATSIAVGTADRHRAALAELVDLPGPAPDGRG